MTAGLDLFFTQPVDLARLQHAIAVAYGVAEQTVGVVLKGPRINATEWMIVGVCAPAPGEFCFHVSIGHLWDDPRNEVELGQVIADHSGVPCLSLREGPAPYDAWLFTPGNGHALVKLDPDAFDDDNVLRLRSNTLREVPAQSSVAPDGSPSVAPEAGAPSSAPRVNAGIGQTPKGDGGDGKDGQ